MQLYALTISDIWAFERSFGIVAKSSLVIVAIAIIIAILCVPLVCTFWFWIYFLLYFFNCFKFNMERHRGNAS